MGPIAAALVQRGEQLLAGPKQWVEFTQDRNADKLLNDLHSYPHAFVLACIMDRQIKAERAWAVPYKLAQQLGNFQFDTLRALSLKDIKRLMSKPEPLHRFVDTMSEALHAGINRIAVEYDADASRIWADTPASAEVVYRFLQFRGIGPKIATMAANILARNFKVPFADHYSIDVSADVHVRRVFVRLGLCAQDASVEQVIYRARSLYPKFPGIVDSPCWEIGRTWCGSRRQDCAGCYMNQVCPSRSTV